MHKKLIIIIIFFFVSNKSISQSLYDLENCSSYDCIDKWLVNWEESITNEFRIAAKLVNKENRQNKCVSILEGIGNKIHYYRNEPLRGPIRTHTRNILTKKDASEDFINEFIKKYDSAYERIRMVYQKSLNGETNFQSSTNSNLSSSPQVANNSIKTISIGNQTWMADNLNVDRFLNGDLILHAQTPEEWKKASENEIPAWCYHENNASNGETYGKLYNYFAITDSRGIAPKGFHIPTEKEFELLINFYQGGEIAGSKLKSISGWQENGNGTISNGFSAKPGGFRTTNGVFGQIYTGGHIETFIGKSATFWAINSSSTLLTSYLNLYFDKKIAELGTGFFKGAGYSIRCLKD